MKIFTALMSLGLVVGLVTSCVPSTPQSRIYQRPQDFDRLSEKHQELVKRGEIDKGMGRDAVSLAWGSPSARIDGFRNGEVMERWDYNGRQAVTTYNTFGGYSRGYYGPYRSSGYRAGFGPEVTYIPYRRASVWFVDGKVNAWERMR